VKQKEDQERWWSTWLGFRRYQLRISKNHRLSWGFSSFSSVSPSECRDNK